MPDCVKLYQNQRFAGEILCRESVCAILQNSSIDPWIYQLQKLPLVREAVAQQAQGARAACAILPYGITSAVKRPGRMLGKNIFFRILSIIFRCRPFSTPCAVFSGNGEWGMVYLTQSTRSPRSYALSILSINSFAHATASSTVSRTASPLPASA